MEPAYLRTLAHCVRVSIGLDPGPANVPAGNGLARLLEIADDHGLLPHVIAAGVSGPDGWLARWSAACLVLAAETARLAARLESNGIRVMPLKGPVLSYMLFADSSRRHYSDLDLIVLPEQVESARVLLGKEGYEPVWNSRAAARQRRFDWYGEMPLRHARNAISLDLHWWLTPRYYPARMDDRAVWERAVRVPFPGHAVETPAPEDYLEYLCLHAARHEWSRLGWLADLAAFRYRFGDRIRLAEILGRPGGAYVAEGLRRAAEWIAEPAGGLGTPPPVPLWKRARYRAAVALIPTEADWNGVDLPNGFDLLYYPIRLGRLMRQRIGRAL